MKHNGGNSLSKCQLVKTMSKARVRNTCNGEKTSGFALCLSTGILVTFSLYSFTHSACYYYFLWGYLFIYLFIINYNASYIHDISFVIFRLLFITCIHWIRGSSLSVNDIHTLSCTCTSLSITCILFSGCFTYTLHMYSYRLKLPSLLEHQVQVFSVW